MTSGQRDVLAALTDGPSFVGELYDMGTKDAVRARLRRLEDRGLVRRIYPDGSTGAWWELTHAGRSALQLTG